MESFGLSRGLSVRRIDRSEFARFDALLDQHHWLGRGLVGETMRHVGVIDDEWVALVGYGAAALTLSARDRWVGWSPENRYRRLRFVANNQRFCVLGSPAPKNLASAVLGASLRRLSADWQDTWGHPVVLVETFTDPVRHLGTCYQATNFEQVGATSGWRRSRDSYVHHGTPKAVWLRPLRKGAASILSGTFDHPIITRHPRRRPIIDANKLDFDTPNGLLARLGTLPEHRSARGIRHSGVSIIAVGVVATLCGARSFIAIGEVAADLPQEVLARLGCKFHPTRRRYVVPSEPTIRRHLQAVDANELDAVVGSWLADQSAKGNVDGALVGIAVDGKAVRGAKTADGRCAFLFAGMLHSTGAVIAQQEVDSKTNEIKALRPLFADQESLAGVVVTADAMHAQRDHAQFIVDEKHGDYLVGVKGNQPTLLNLIETLPAGDFSP